MPAPGIDNLENVPETATTLKRKCLSFSLAASLLLLLVIETICIWQYQLSTIIGVSDFVEYWTAGQLLLQGENPYDFEALYQLENEVGGRPMPMLTPPWTPVLLFPLLFLPFPIATLIWFWCSLALLLLCATVLWRRYASDLAPRTIRIAWIATLIFMPALFGLRIGQISVLLLLGVTGFLFFIERRHDALAGSSLALTLIKPHVVYLLLIVVGWWILKEGRWRVLLGLLGTMVALLAALLLISPNSLFYYWQAFQQAPSLYWCPTTLGGGLRYFLGPELIWLQFIPPLVSSLLMGVLLFVCRPTIHWLQWLPPILLISAPTSAYGWVIDLVVLLPSYLLVWAWFLERKRERKPLDYLVLGALLLTNGLMLGQNLLKVEEIYSLWVPLALGLVYLYGWWTLKRNVPAESLRESQ